VPTCKIRQAIVAGGLCALCLGATSAPPGAAHHARQPSAIVITLAAGGAASPDHEQPHPPETGGTKPADNVMALVADGGPWLTLDDPVLGQLNRKNKLAP
jgi:hypothetical protein